METKNNAEMLAKLFDSFERTETVEPYDTIPVVFRDLF